MVNHPTYNCNLSSSIFGNASKIPNIVELAVVFKVIYHYITFNINRIDDTFFDSIFINI